MDSEHLFLNITDATLPDPHSKLILNASATLNVTLAEAICLK